MTAAAQTMYQSERHLRAFVRQPWFVLMAIIQPVIWLLLFGALFQNVTLIPGFAAGGSYLDYLVPGVLVMTALFSCGWSGMSIIEDLDRSIVDRFLVTPVHRSAIIGGLTIYQLVSLVIQATIIGGLALLLGAHFDGGLLGYGAPRRRLQPARGRPWPTGPAGARQGSRVARTRTSFFVTRARGL